MNTSIRVKTKREMTIEVDIQIACNASETPSKNKLKKWACFTLLEFLDKGEITIRIVDAAESRQLNQRWRKINKPTNVLSFYYGENTAPVNNYIGDIVLCAPVIIKEAKEQKKNIEAHFAHMVIHGCLHLMGYDHEKKREADEMETLEIDLMHKLGFTNPYQVIED